MLSPYNKYFQNKLKLFLFDFYLNFIKPKLLFMYVKQSVLATLCFILILFYLAMIAKGFLGV